MKTVLLLGDSIRQLYCKEVETVFAGQVQILYPEENCRFSTYFLRNLNDWRGKLSPDGKADLIHWNAGLWDCLRQYGEDPLVPPEIYRYYIERICRRMQFLFPNAKCVFAATTPVREEKFNTPETFRRFNADVRRYNEIAAEIVTRFGMEVDDLYAVAEQFPADWYQDATHPDSIPGRCALARQVVTCISRSLDIPTPEVPDDIAVQVGSIQVIGV